MVLTCYMRSVGDVEEIVFGDRFGDRVQDVAWPDSVVCLGLSVAFEQEIDGVQWPALFLQELTFLTVISTMCWGEERGRAL